jgi:hypothetical protein
MADSQISERTERELAALADGRLRGRRRRRLEAELRRSPELRSLLAEQRAAVTALGEVEELAPAALHARVEAARSSPRPAQRAGRRAVRLAAGAAAVALAAALVLALLLPGGAPGGPSVVEAAALAERGASEPAPAISSESPALLERRAEGLPFPNWAAKFGWRPAGARRDRLDGRRATTVFYLKGRQRIAYTILSGEPLENPPRSSPAAREGTRVRRLATDGRSVVTWLRERHSCVLSGRGVPPEVLLRLAAWKGKGQVPF